jgi:tetratricopeptide (TPR) repeat protein
MSRYFLAIPAVLFLVISSASRGCAQSESQPPATPPASQAAAAPAPTPLSQEDLGRLYLVRKQYREAEEVFHRLAQQNPKNAVYWNELGIAYHNQTELDSALKCYQKSLKINSAYADAQNNIGTVYYERKKYPKAIRAYKKAIAMRGEFAPFYLNLGYAYFGQKEYEDSITAFRKALQLDPEALEANRSRSGTVIQDRSMSSDRGHFYFLLAKSFAESGNVERCLLYLKKAKDEGYADMNSVKTDPSFAAAMKDPSMQEILTPKPAETAQP